MCEVSFRLNMSDVGWIIRARVGVSGINVCHLKSENDNCKPFVIGVSGRIFDTSVLGSMCFARVNV